MSPELNIPYPLKGGIAIRTLENDPVTTQLLYAQISYMFGGDNNKFDLVISPDVETFVDSISQLVQTTSIRRVVILLDGATPLDSHNTETNSNAYLVALKKIQDILKEVQDLVVAIIPFSGTVDNMKGKLNIDPSLRNRVIILDWKKPMNLEELEQKLLSIGDNPLFTWVNPI